MRKSTHFGANVVFLRTNLYRKTFQRMGIETMNTNHEILSTAELEDTAHYARACQAKYEDIRHRLRKQKEVVEECSEYLGKLVNERAWERAATPDSAREARQECAEAADRYQEEYQLLNAMETAAINAKIEADRASKKVFGVISGIVTAQIGGADFQALIEGGTVINSRVTA